MDSSRRIFVAVFVFLFVAVFCNNVFPAFVDGEGNEFIKNNDEKPSLLKIVWRTFGKRFPPRSWELFRTSINKIQMKFYPPNLDFRGSSEEKGQEDNDAGEKVKEAAKNVLSTSKETIEESAKIAGCVVGEAVQRTADKVKKKALDSNAEGSHDEL